MARIPGPAGLILLVASALAGCEDVADWIRDSETLSEIAEDGEIRVVDVEF